LAVRNGDRTIGIDFSPGGEHLFMLNRDSVSRWNPTSLARPVSRLRDAEMPNGMETTTMSIRPDGRELLFAYANKLIFLDTHNLEKTRPSWVLGDDILEAKYLPGGTRILVGRRDSVAQVLDANTGEPVGRPLTHTSAVLSLAVRPDGQLLLTGSRDGTARFWDAATGLPLGPPLRHAGPVTHLGFNPKGLQVASGTGVGEVNLWPLPPPPLSGSLEELQAMRQKLTK
jgi:WD40 repeat protein